MQEGPDAGRTLESSLLQILTVTDRDRVVRWGGNGSEAVDLLGGPGEN